MRNRRLIWLSPMCVPFTWGQQVGIGTKLHIVIDGAWKTIAAISIVIGGAWKVISRVKVTSRQAWK